MAETESQQPFFGIEKIYIKDISFEAPGAPAVFLQNQQPEIGVQMSLAHRPIDTGQGFYEVMLTVHVSAKTSAQTLFLVELQQAGVFRVQGLTGDALTRTLEITCAYVLLPFVREAVSELVGKGGFPQLLITPINFDALYEQKRANAQQSAQQQAS